MHLCQCSKLALTALLIIENFYVLFKCTIQMNSLLKISTVRKRSLTSPDVCPDMDWLFIVQKTSTVQINSTIEMIANIEMLLLFEWLLLIKWLLLFEWLHYWRLLLFKRGHPRPASPEPRQGLTIWNIYVIQKTSTIQIVLFLWLLMFKPFY